MPLNDLKVLQIILAEVQASEERCVGYRKILKETLAEIIELERLHQIQKTNIQKQIGDKCNATGRWLATHTEDVPGVPDGE